MPSLLLPKQNIPGTSLLAAILVAISFALALPAQAQTYTVLHQFTGGSDGAFPQAGLSIDARGRLYGTTTGGGLTGPYCQGCGVVFQLAPEGPGWTLNPLYEFKGPNDGAVPLARPVFGPGGILYGTTNEGGANCSGGPGCGTVYSLRPGPTACRSALCAWSESIVYSLGGVGYRCTGMDTASSGHRGNSQGQPNQTLENCNPGPGDLTFDQAGNIYGTVESSYGAVYQLTPTGTATALHTFTAGSDGAYPESGVNSDQAGNLYGTTSGGGSHNCGTVYELSPSGSGWTEQVIYSFQCASDGETPIGGLILDASSNLYGTTNFGGANHGGTVFELTPSGDSWTFHLVYSLTYTGYFDNIYYGPTGSLVMDASGSLYGTTVMDGVFDEGSVFKLTPSNGGWTYTSLHDFGSLAGGVNPFGNITFDSNGNLYGTASEGGIENCGTGNGCGVVWEITP